MEIKVENKDLFSQENDIIVPENFNEADEQLAKIAEMSKRPYLLLKENNFFEAKIAFEEILKIFYLLALNF